MALSLEQASQGTFCLSKVGLAIGSTTSQLSTAAASVAVVDGKFIAAKAATATFAITADSGSLASVPIGSKAAHAVWLDSAGNLTVTQGPLTPFTASSDKVAPPPRVAGKVCIAVFTVAAVSAQWVPGTTAMNAAGVTTTYTDVMDLPGEAIA